MTETSPVKQRGPGRPFPRGVSGNPKGRPRGSGLVGDMRRAIADHASEVLDALVRKALEGDVQACRALLDRVCPPLRAESLPVMVPGMEAGSLSGRAEAAMKAVAQGNLSPDTAAALMAAVGALAKVREVDELERRIAALEAST